MTLDPYPDLPGAELPAAARASGVDAGERAQLSEAESRLLDALFRPAPAVVTAVEDELRAARPSWDAGGVPLPTPIGRPLAPVFREPD